MASSGLLGRVTLVRTDVSEEIQFVFLRSVRLLVTANVVPSSPILVTLMMEALISPKTSLIIRATRRNIPEDAILHSHRRENIKSYIVCHVLLQATGVLRPVELLESLTSQFRSCHFSALHEQNGLR
jgi:hypothetical protein